MKANGLPIFNGNAHPVNLYCGTHKIAGWREDAQTGADMPFKGTYNDRVDLDILGKSTQVQTVQGVNLCPTDFSEWESGHYDMTTGAKAVNTQRLRLKRLIKVLPSTKYYFTTYSNGTYAFVVRAYDVNGVFLTSTGFVANGSNVTFASNVYYLGISMMNGASEASMSYSVWESEFNAGNVNPYICLDTQADKTWAAYVPDSPSPYYPSPIISVDGEAQVEGRNLLPPFTDWGTLPPYWTATQDTLIVGAINSKYSPYIRVSGTITVSAHVDKPLSNAATRRRYLYEYDENQTQIKLTSFWDTVPKVFALDANTRYVRLQINIGTTYDDLPITYSNVQIVRGSYNETTIPKYTPYRPILTHALPELLGIPDGAGGWFARDTGYIERVGGVPHLFKIPYIEYREFDGTEVWWHAEKYGNGYAFALSNFIPAIRIQYPRWMCTHVKAIPSYQIGYDEGCFLYQYGDYRCIIKLLPERIGILESDTPAQRVTKYKALLAAAKASGAPYAIAYPRLTPGDPVDLGPIDLPTYYPFTRVIVSGEYPPDVTARCKAIDTSL